MFNTVIAHNLSLTISLVLIYFYSIPNLFIIFISENPKRESALSEESQMTLTQSSVACEIPVKPDQ